MKELVELNKISLEEGVYKYNKNGHICLSIKLNQSLMYQEDQHKVGYLLYKFILMSAVYISTKVKSQMTRE